MRYKVGNSGYGVLFLIFLIKFRVVGEYIRYHEEELEKQKLTDEYVLGRK